MKPEILLLRAGPVCVSLLAVAVSLASSHPARAGMITVVGDVSAQNNFSFFDAVLGNQTSVVFSRAAVQQPTLRTHWDQLPGVTAIESSAELTTTFPSGADLLVVTNNFSAPLDYTASDNDFLFGIGSSIRFNDVRTSTLETVSPENTPLTAGLADFNTSAYNTLTGGPVRWTSIGVRVNRIENSLR